MDESCFYCTKNKPLGDLMVEICKLSVSTVYLFKEQTYAGRCNVVLNSHTGNLFDLSPNNLHAFIDDVANTANAINIIFSPDKINYGAYSDKMQHLHMHIVPKYKDGQNWGDTFEMNPQKTYLSDDEYIKLAGKIKEKLK
ncbi:MAG: HIT family protein [Eubacterium sp.]|jgi:diadenosine tetraphosphate (Ap4A) HIT family hydrolase|nr:HIT family protein [Eubacterium sp.]